jgi:hypothetical protein
MTATSGTQRAMVASMVCCKGTELARQFVLDAVPSTWEPPVRIAMWLMSKVMGLANVD